MGGPLPFCKRINKYCNNSCAAKHNNIIRIHSNKTKELISTSVKEYYISEDVMIGRCSPITYNSCYICNSLFITKYAKKKYCSVPCLKIHQSRHGQKQRDNHFNRHFYKKAMFISKYHGTLTLDSTWEVKMAQELEDNNIKWYKPKPFTWVDIKNKTRNYYPDFYLPDYNIYIEPKNPYLMKKDKHKIEYVIKYHKIQIILICNKLELTWKNIQEKMLSPHGL